MTASTCGGLRLVPAAVFPWLMNTKRPWSCSGSSARVVSRHEPIERSPLRDQGQLVHLDGEAEEQREVGLHLGVEAVDSVDADLLLGVPVPRQEGLLDELGVANPQTWAAAPREPPEHAVLRMHELASKRAEAEELTADSREGPIDERHFLAVHRRPDRLGSQARVGDANLGSDQGAAIVDEDPRVSVQGAEDADPVEEVVGSPVQEVRVIEHRVDDRRGVPWLDPPRVHAGHAEDLVEIGLPQVEGARRVHPLEPGAEDPLRRCHVVRVVKNLPPLMVVLFRVREGVERKVGLLQRVVGAATGAGAGRTEEVLLGRLHVPEPRVQLVLDPVVGEGVKVARAAGLTVAAGLHVPEQRLAEPDRGLLGGRAGFQELGEIVDLGDRHLRQGVESGGPGRRPHCLRIQCLRKSLSARAYQTHSHERHEPGESGSRNSAHVSAHTCSPPLSDADGSRVVIFHPTSGGSNREPEVALPNSL